MAPMAWSPLGRRQPVRRLARPRRERVGPRAGARRRGELDVDTGSVALAWLLRLPSRPIPVLGTSRIDRLRDLARADRLELDRQTWFDAPGGEHSATRCPSLPRLAAAPPPDDARTLATVAALCAALLLPPIVAYELVWEVAAALGYAACAAAIAVFAVPPAPRRFLTPYRFSVHRVAGNALLNSPRSCTLRSWWPSTRSCSTIWAG